jgi:mono/diheme cytochrome c family protein
MKKLIVLILFALPLTAAESPRDVWVKTKCALCHGIDGRGQTDTGKKTNAPDLTTPEIRKLTDERLATSIAGGHKRMPSFRRQVDPKRVEKLIAYIRALPPAAER